MNPPRVSVVIPTARGGAYLREAVGSVLAQTLAALELIVVADGCADDLTDLAATDRRVTVIDQERRGVSVARNVGVRAARAELIAFLDDDDRMLPGRLEAQAAALTAHPGAGLCHTQFRVIGPDGAPLDQGFAADIQYLDLLRRDVRILLPTVMARRSTLEEVGLFDPTLRTGEDLDVLYRIAREYELVFRPEVLTEYRRHGANTSGDTVQAASDSVRLLEKHRRDARLRGCTDRDDAARLGLVVARRLGAAASIEAARRAWSAPERAGSARATGAVRAVGTAVALAPAYTVGDLVANRRPVTTARSYARRLAGSRKG